MDKSHLTTVFCAFKFHFVAEMNQKLYEKYPMTTTSEGK